ncbi:MAG: YcgN family cysteine cluster protein [Saccharospirillaceae bacterium]|nr:YcgN family cysteine cluster protein [Pseudomonadales bacterium]NRB78649.1 YcgN family cysteine cluster protein [Saccharospirillaceae bacterium]
MSFPFTPLPFLDDLDQKQWESLCDGCAKCCLQKLEDDFDSTVYYTNLVCQYMSDDCRCTVYQKRQELVPNCVWLKKEDVENFYWLPNTCSYRLVNERTPLALWHPLNDLEKNAKISNTVRNKQSISSQKIIKDNTVPEQDWEEHIINWVE